MKLYRHVIKDLKRIFDQRISLFMLIIIPILTTMILGYVFDDAGNKLNLNTKGAIVLKSDKYGLEKDIKSIFKEVGFEVIKMDENSAKEELNKNNIENYIVIFDNKIDFFKSSSSSSMTNLVVEDIVHEMGKISERMAVSKDGIEKFQKDIKEFKGENPEYKIKNKNFIKEESIILNRKPTALDYFGITQLTLIIAMANTLAFWNLKIEHSKKTLDRVKTAPSSLKDFFLGKVISLLIFSIVQIGVILLVNTFVFKIYYGNIFFTIAVVLAFALFNTAIGLFVSSISFKKEKSSPISLITYFLIFIGGGFAPIENFKGTFIEKISVISPVYWVNQALFKSIYFSVFKEYSISMIMSLSISFILLILAYKNVKREV